MCLDLSITSKNVLYDFIVGVSAISRPLKHFLTPLVQGDTVYCLIGFVHWLPLLCFVLGFAVSCSPITAATTTLKQFPIDKYSWGAKILASLGQQISLAYWPWNEFLHYPAHLPKASVK